MLQCYLVKQQVVTICDNGFQSRKNNLKALFLVLIDLSGTSSRHFHVSFSHGISEGAPLLTHVLHWSLASQCGASTGQLRSCKKLWIFSDFSTNLWNFCIDIPTLHSQTQHTFVQTIQLHTSHAVVLQYFFGVGSFPFPHKTGGLLHIVWICTWVKRTAGSRLLAQSFDVFLTS